MVLRNVRAEELLLLFGKVSSVLTSSLDLAAAVVGLAELAVPDLADWCAVEIVQGDDLAQLAVAHVDPEKEELMRALRQRYPPGRAFPHGVWSVVRAGRPELHEQISDGALAAAAQDAEHLQMLRDIGLQSLLIVPLSTRGRTLGALLLGTVSGRQLSASDVPVASEIARRAAIAIDNAQLYEAEQRARREAERMADRLARLQALLESLTAARTSAEIAEVVLGQGLAALGAYAGVVTLVDAGREVLEIVHAAGYPGDVDPYRRMPLAAPVPLTEAVRLGEPIWIRSSHELATRYPPLSGATRTGTGSQSIAALPMLVRGAASGALGLSFREPRAFPPEEQAFMLTLARQCGLALDRACLYEAEQVARARLERLYEQAQRAVQAREDLLAIVSHDLRNPLGVVSMSAALIARVRVEGEDGERVRRHAERISRAADRMTLLIRDLLDAASIEAGHLRVDAGSHDVEELIAEAIEHHGPLAAERGVQLERDVAARGPIRCDRDRILQVFSNLLGNAIKFTPQGGAVMVAAARDEASVRFEVIDTGPGIPAEQVPHLFDRYWRAKPAQAGGNGLGLFIAKGIVEAHGGALGVVTAPGAGSTFHFTLPADAG